MSTVQSFAPIAAPDAVVLILGSMPGKLSLARNEYYAHPQNLFWRFMGELFGAGPELAYAARVEKLQSQRIAVWDVLRQCFRETSMDSDIVPDSMRVNDFATFFAQHPHIQQVFFNGSTAENVFRRLVLPNLEITGLELTRLPSTSPANASIPFAEKLASWQAVRTASFSESR